MHMHCLCMACVHAVHKFMRRLMHRLMRRLMHTCHSPCACTCHAHAMHAPCTCRTAPSPQAVVEDALEMLLEELDLVDQSEEFLMGLIGLDPEVRTAYACGGVRLWCTHVACACGVRMVCMVHAYVVRIWYARCTQ